ncbi:MAG: hypothetical protein LQ352_004773 [Teloschistes flavicans]|nr:MAG: hypothetical protein LQ352_004773 [Teloschistes flavicans]
MAASSRKHKSRSEDDDSSGPNVPPPPRRGRQSDDEFMSPRKRRRHSRYASGYDMPREKNPKIDMLLCVFHSPSSHTWRTAPLSFDRRRIDDRELWEDIRDTYRMELQMAWRRIFSMKRLKHIVPVTYSHNGVPCQQDASKYPNSHTFMHGYHHPDRVRRDHVWVDWFTQFKDENPKQTIGLQFVEGLWAEKLVAIALLITLAIIIVSVVWVVKGGNLQTVFTVMSFVLTGAAGKCSFSAALRFLRLATKAAVSHQAC